MIIKFTKTFRDEDGVQRTEYANKQILLWKNHRNYMTHRERSMQSNMLVVSRVGGRDGYFLSKEKFRKFLLDGTIKIVDPKEI
ncbi:MAG TPA: hypothetical protein PKL44_00265 [Candidatus Dojkabacteria bacterium]|nr:hypothetical protein [Candidatus Dojkabacteria bacterium]